MSDTLTAQTAPWATPRPTDDNIARRSDEALERERNRPNAGASIAFDAKAWATPRAEDAVTWKTVWPVVSGMPNRAAGCRLVGNAVVPQIPLAIFMAIAEAEG